jgi:type V secretory pathway adhesin AidA
LFVENTAAFLADFPVPASYAAAGGWSLDGLATLDSSNTLDGGGRVITGVVFFDEPDREILNNRAISSDYTITYRTLDFPGLVSGDEITVNGTLYVVLHAMKIEDGVFSRAILEL